MPSSDGFCVFLGRRLVGTMSHAWLCARAQPCRLQMIFPCSWEGRWFGHCLKRGFVRALNHTAIQSLVLVQWDGVGWDSVSSGALLALNHTVPEWLLKRGFVLALNHDVLEWLARTPGEVVGENSVSSGVLCSRSTIPSSIFLRFSGEDVDWDSVSSGALCSHSTMTSSNSLRELLGGSLVGSLSRAGLCARAQPCRP